MSLNLGLIFVIKKQRWNKDISRCECKEWIDQRVCDKGFIWNPSNCECGCDKLCNIGEYLGHKNCKYRKKIVDKLIDECTEAIEQVKLAEITLKNKKSYYKYGSCKVYIVFMIVVFTIFTGITIYFVYYNWSLFKNNVSCIKFIARKETKI